MWYYIYFVSIQLVAYIFWEKPSESPLQWLIILIASYYYGFSFLDYINERRRRNVSESIIFIRKHSGLAISIGLFYYLMIFIAFYQTRSRTILRPQYLFTLFILFIIENHDITAIL